MTKPNKQHDPQITWVDAGTLTPYINNAKKHPEKQIHQIAESIKQFGFINPILVDDKNIVIAGHGRLEAAKLIGMAEVPVILISHLSEEEARAYRLADNQLTMNTGYDDGLLKIELTELNALDLDFELEITGFETATLDLIIDQSNMADNDEADELPDIDDNTVPVTQLGDIWQLGDHRLICGDATQAETYQKLMGDDDKAQAIFTDPPYNVPVDGHVCGAGKIKHREFAMASGEMTRDEFLTFLSSFIKMSIEHSVDGSLHYICMDWRHIRDLIESSDGLYSDLKNICVWNKDNGGMGSLYRSKHEFVAVFKNGTAPHTNNIKLGKHGRYRTNVWDYKGVNSFGSNQADLKMHPTVKPVAMVSDAIKDCTKREQSVLDPFSGSGTTLMACEKSGRHARCIELDPIYCDVIIKRWQDLTGLDAVHSVTGKTFTEIKEDDHE